MRRFCFLLVFFLYSMVTTYGQTNLKVQKAISGTIFDSITDQPISESTVTLYQHNGVKVLKYSFSNSKGAFLLAAIPPVDSVFAVEVTHMGYLPLRHTVRFKPGADLIEMGKIALQKKSIEIEEVEINRPPIMMNRDTLVINPAAFDLQPNAVVEDLLKKIPGIVVWADGDITVNGKKVERVLVNGKPFFGSANVVSTRNIPNTAVDKVKLYEKTITQPNEESKMEVDIILKKSNGIFGKAQVGMGTTGRQEGVLLLNYFDAKNQVSVFGGKNNTNTRVQSLNEIQRGNVFKAGGEDFNVYAPVFTKPGLNTFAVAGGQFKRDWTSQFKTDINALYTSEDTKINTDLTEFRYFDNRTDQRVTQQIQSHRGQLQLKMSGMMQYKDKTNQLTVNTQLRHVNMSNEQKREREVWTEDELLSKFDVDNQIASRQNITELNVDYNNKYTNEWIGKYRLKLNYRFYRTGQDNEDLQQSSFLDNVKQRTEKVNRVRNQRVDRNEHQLTAALDLNPFLKKIGIFGWDFNLKNTAKWLDIRSHQWDGHFDSLNNSYTLINESLTYKDSYDDITWAPGLDLGKSKMINIARGSNSYGFNVGTDLALNFRTNTSTNAYRGLDQYNLYVVPTASTYYKQIRKLRESVWRLHAKTIILQPEMEQQLAVRDETQKDHNRLGNIKLKPEQQYKFGMQYTRTGVRDNSSQQLDVNYTWIANQMVDSSFYLEEGERISYIVNTDGRPSYDLRYTYRGAPKIGHVPLNIQLRANAGKSENYYFNANSQYLNSSWNADLDVSVAATFFSYYRIAVGTDNGRRVSKSSNYKTHNGTNSISLNATVTRFSRLTLISSIAATNFYVKDVSSDNQFFWNAHVYYRMLEKEQLEVKLSALDILNGSKNIKMYSNDNIVGRQQSNNLKRYFMLSLAYYPRFF